jgi:hypothetical protein
MQLRTVALVAGLSVALGWALGGRVQPQAPADVTTGRGGSGPRPLGTPPTSAAPLTEQLRLRLEQKPRAPRSARNPFVFGSRRPAPAPESPARTHRPEAADAAAVPVAAPPAPGSEFRLTGMAANAGPDGPDYTAIVHDGRDLVFVKRGDTLPGGFVVVDVQESTVTLRDGSGGERTLRLP